MSKEKIENEKINTCEDKENEEFKILYDNYFLKKDNSLSDDFQFDINEKVIDFIKKNNIISYPRKTFRGTKQGNFLYFMHLIYEKKLPLYFTVDQIIYPYIELTNDITQKIIEEGIYKIFYNFLKEIIEYGYKNNFDKKIITYFFNRL